MERMKLLVESIDNDVLDYLTEGLDNTHWQDKTYKIKGVFMEANTKNKNGRIYPLEIIENEVTRYSNEEIKQCRSTSDIDHPASVSAPMLSTASHLITSLTIKENLVYGEAKVLNTDKGRNLKALIHDGVRFGMSSRALGSLNPQGIVEKNFRLLGVDAVQNASAHAATLVDSLVENFDYIISGNEIIKVHVDEFKKDLAKHGKKQLAEDLQKFLSSYDKR